MPRNPTLPLIEGLDLVTSVEITRDKTSFTVLGPNGKPTTITKDCYHFLYASTLYGTIFGAFGKFETKELDSTHREVTSLTMRILNYQGLLNIGFVKEKKPTYDASGRDLDFWVQGMSGEDKMDVPFGNIAVPPTPPLIVEKGVPFRLTFNRIVVPLPDFVMEADHTHQLPTPSQVDPYFDTEFHYRDGTDHYPQATRDGMGQKGRKLAGYRCLSSTVNLFY